MPEELEAQVQPGTDATSVPVATTDVSTEPPAASETPAPSADTDAWREYVRQADPADLERDFPHLQRYIAGKAGQIAETKRQHELPQLRQQIQDELSAQLTPQLRRQLVPEVRSEVEMELLQRDIRTLRETDPVRALELTDELERRRTEFADRQTQATTLTETYRQMHSAATLDALRQIGLDDDSLRAWAAALPPAVRAELAARPYEPSVAGRAQYRRDMEESLAQLQAAGTAPPPSQNGTTPPAAKAKAAPTEVDLRKQLADTQKQLEALETAAAADALATANGGTSVDVGSATAGGPGGLPTPAEWQGMGFNRRRQMKAQNPRIEDQIIARYAG
jgi:hypothetical protein